MSLRDGTERPRSCLLSGERNLPLSQDDGDTDSCFLIDDMVLLVRLLDVDVLARMTS
jgi:hypothetical protein